MRWVGVEQPGGARHAARVKKSSRPKKQTKHAISRRVGNHQRSAQARQQARRDRKGGGKG
jgi:hypothetical protein